MKHLQFMKLAIPVAILVTGGFEGIPAEDAEKVSISFRDIHKMAKSRCSGTSAFRSIVTLEGRMAEASKISNNWTLRFTKLNGIAVAKQGETGWPPLIQIQNVETLPKDETVIVEGYEFLSWRGDPQTNWHMDVSFIVTRVIAPQGLKTNGRQP